MTDYKLQVKRSAVKELERLPKSIWRRVKNDIESLSCDPFPIGVSRVKGISDFFRIRIGSYHVVYEVDKAQKVITVYKIGHRKDVYRGY